MFLIAECVAYHAFLSFVVRLRIIKLEEQEEVMEQYQPEAEISPEGRDQPYEAEEPPETGYELYLLLLFLFLFRYLLVAGYQQAN